MISNDIKNECVFCEQFPSEKNDSEDAQRAMADFNGNVANGDGEDLDDFDFDSNRSRVLLKKEYRITFSPSGTFFTQCKTFSIFEVETKPAYPGSAITFSQ